MCFPRPFLIVLTGLLFSMTAAATVQQRVEKDSTGLTILSRMASVTGWTRANLPLDVTASGNLVRKSEEGQVTTPIRLKARGHGQFRTELPDPAKPHTTIVNGAAAAQVTGSGQAYRLPPHVALSTRPVMFPFLIQLGDFDQPDVSIRYWGTEDVAGEPAHKIEISRNPMGDEALTDAIRRSSPLTVWVSATSYLPLQIDYIRLATSNRRAVQHFLRRFSDYRQVNAILIPFLQEEWVEGELQYALQLSAVQFNAGLTDLDFEVPKQ